MMKRLFICLLTLCWFSMIQANEVETLYQGPYAIGDWGTVEISSIKFHNLEIGDTVYVYTSKVDSTSQGSFQSHRWGDLPGVINGQAITGDYEFVVKSEEVLNELKQFGLKVRGYNYVVEKVVIKQVLDDDELDMAVGGTSAPCRPVGVLYKKDRPLLSEGSPISVTCAYKR